MNKLQAICSHIVNINPPDISKGNLYLGSIDAALDCSLKKQNHIGCVLSVIDARAYRGFKIRQKLRIQQINEHKWIDLEDVEDDSAYPYFDESYSFIKENLTKHNVLVHCQKGSSRSSTFIIAFIMKEYGMTYMNARSVVEAKRKIGPNQGFVKDLLRYQDFLSK